MTAPSPDQAAGISQQQAAAELLRRQRARQSLVEYARAVDIPGAPANADPENEVFKKVESAVALHHRVIMTAIQRTIDPEFPGYRTNGRLMIFAPPGSAKSSYASVVTPSWALSKWESYRIILASYALDIAAKHSRKARALCRQPRHVSIWPNKPLLADDQRAVAQWALNNGSEFMAAGFQSGITGNRANGILIDDPVANREDADSETIQKKTKEEYQDSVDTRLMPGGWIILIQTRWNENDLAGSILPEDYKGQSGMIECRDGQVWEVINIPAEAEHDDDPLGRAKGEFLWPEWFPREHWMIRKTNPQAKRTWAALFQQRPTAGEGIEFKLEWFDKLYYDPDIPAGKPGGRPARLALYGGSDFATKEDRSADFTEHGLWGVDAQMDLWVLDWWYGQKTSDKYIAEWIAMILRWKAKGHIIRKWWDEGNVIGHSIAPARNLAMRENKAMVVTEALTSIKNKGLKLASFQAHAAAMRVHFPSPRKCPWTTRVIGQLTGFPASRYDDASDVCGIVGRGIDKMGGVHVPSVEVRKIVTPFTEAWFEQEDNSDAPRIRYS